MKNLLIICSILGLVACSSDPKKVVVVDTHLDSTQVIDSKTVIGEKENDEAVFQRKADLVNSLLSLEDEVMLLNDKLNGTPSYGSEGDIKYIQKCSGAKEVKKVVIEEENEMVIKEKNTNKLILLTEEDLNDRIARFKNYRKLLYQEQEQINAVLAECSK